MAFTLRTEDGTGLQLGEVAHLTQPADGNTITIYDGTNTAVVFEYDGNVLVTGDNTAVTIGSSPTETATNLLNAISTARTNGLLDVTGEVDGSFPHTLHLRNLNTTKGSIVFVGSGVKVVTFTAPNSYATLVEVDDILKENIHADSWFALPDGDRERLIVYATKTLDDRTRWFGTKTIETSSLRWPRTGITDRDGRTVGDNEIPDQLKRAVAYMARYNADQDRFIERSQDALDSLRVDVIELDFSDGYVLPQIPNSIQFMLEGLGSVRGSANGFSKVLRT